MWRMLPKPIADNPFASATNGEGTGRAARSTTGIADIARPLSAQGSLNSGHVETYDLFTDTQRRDASLFNPNPNRVGPDLQILSELPYC